MPLDFERTHQAVTLIAAVHVAALLAHGAAKSETLESAPAIVVERVTTIAPFPRGLAMVDGKLYVLCRGRVRGAGGVSAEIEDQAGTIYIVDPEIAEPADRGEVSDAVRNNGVVFALPSDPPFRLWDRTADPPQSDRRTDRPYCTLRDHEGTKSFYLCAFSGIDLAQRTGEGSFSKNQSDAMLRFDRRTHTWYEIERHDAAAPWRYPHHDPAENPPPHGWLKGPDNCLVIDNNLYAVAKDNSVLVRYDLTALVADPNAGFPPSELVLGDHIRLEDGSILRCEGHSALAAHRGYLYIGFRTTSQIVRIALDERGRPVQPIVAELIATYQPWNPQTGESANITDMDFDSAGRVYVMCAEPARVFRFTPDPDHVFDGMDANQKPWLNLAESTGNPRMKCENIMIDDRDRLFITSGQGYGYQHGADGTVWRVTAKD